MISPDDLASLKPHQQELDEALLALDGDGMLLSSVDGFFAGLACSPELVLPGEWLPAIWGADGDENEAVFENVEQARHVTTLVMSHYNEVLEALSAGSYVPIYDVDEASGEILWESWVSGFDLAMRLRADAFVDFYYAADEETVSSLNLMAALIMIDARESELEPEAVEALTADAPGLIPRLVDNLYGWRVRHAQPGVPRRSAKVGRNDPCPCGSGRKHKKCCAAA